LSHSSWTKTGTGEPEDNRQRQNVSNIGNTIICKQRISQPLAKISVWIVSNDCSRVRSSICQMFNFLGIHLSHIFSDNCEDVDVLDM
jgi:hypothetical protein